MSEITSSEQSQKAREKKGSKAKAVAQDSQSPKQSPEPSPEPSPKQSALSVLLLDDSRQWGFAQMELVAVAVALAAEGHAVEIACLKGSELWKRLGQKDAGQNADEQGAKAVFKVLTLSSVWPSLQLLWRYKREAPLLMHAFTPSMAQFMKRLAKRRRVGTTLCMHTFRAMPPAIPENAPKGAAEDKALAQTLALWKDVHKVIFAAEYIQKAWVKCGLTSSQTACVAPALAVQSWADLKAKLEGTNERCVFVVRANLIENSGVDTVLRAMQHLLEKEREAGLKPCFEVRILGAGPYFESLLTAARGLGVEERLAVLGDQALVEVLPKAQALIVTQESLEECLSTGEDVHLQSPAHAFMAAFALGMPIMAPSRAPYTEWGKGVVSFFGEHDVENLTEAMWKIMQDEAFCLEQGAASASMRDFALMPRLEQAYVRIYAQALEQRGWGFMCKKQVSTGY